jgi:polyamine:H+ symporter
MNDDWDAARVVGICSGWRPPVTLTTPRLAVVLFASGTTMHALMSSVAYAGPLPSIAFLVLGYALLALPFAACSAEIACAVPTNASGLMAVRAVCPSFVAVAYTLWILAAEVVECSVACAMAIELIASITSWGAALVALVATFVVLFGCVVLNASGMKTVTLVGLVVAVMTVVVWLLLLIGAAASPSRDTQHVMRVTPTISWVAFILASFRAVARTDVLLATVEEVKRPEESMIQATIASLLARLATAVVAIIVIATVIDPSNYASTIGATWQSVGTALGGEGLGTTLVIVAAATVVAFLMISIMAASRILVGVGEMGLFPASVSEWVAEYNSHGLMTPLNALAVLATLVFITASVFPLRNLLDAAQFMHAVHVVVILATFFQLRRQHPRLPRPYRAPRTERWLAAPLLCALVTIGLSLAHCDVGTAVMLVLLLVTVCIAAGWYVCQFREIDGSVALAGARIAYGAADLHTAAPHTNATAMASMAPMTADTDLESDVDDERKDGGYGTL